MKLDQLQIKLRPRSHWQTIDLGMRVTLHHLKPLFVISLLVTLPLSLLLYSLIQEAWSVCLILFWLKPMIERPLLFYISRSIFSEQISLKEVFNKLPELLKKDWLHAYTIGRISMSRSFNEPVRMLEGLTGEPRKKRLDILHRDQSGSGWLTLFGIHVEMIVQSLIFALPFFLLPHDAMKNGFFHLIMEGSTFTEFLTLASYVFAIALVAPFYVVCGFLLYLNRRTKLECWHIELGFKKMAQRLLPNASMTILLMLLALPVLSPPPAYADTETPIESSECENTEDCVSSEKEDIEANYPKVDSANAEKIRRALEEVLESDKFGEHYQEREYSIAWDKLVDWDWKWDDDDEEKDTTSMLKWADAIKDFVDVFKYLIMVLILIAIVYTLAKYKPWLYLPQFRNQRQTLPDEVLGINLKQQTLDPGIFQDIEIQLQQGKLRKALSLMLQYHLLHAVQKNKVPFKRSSTESECVTLMERYCPAEDAQSFDILVSYWQQLAYAHSALNSFEIQQFFSRWQQLFTAGDEE